MEFSEFFCDFPSKSKPQSDGDDRARKAYSQYKFRKVADNPNFAKTKRLHPDNMPSALPELTDDEDEEEERSNEDNDGNNDGGGGGGGNIMETEEEENESELPLVHRERSSKRQKVVRGEAVQGTVYWGDGYLNDRMMEFPDGMSAYGRGHVYE